MKIKYEFATETVEIEVTDAWGATIVDLDRQEYNIDNKETRRHCSWMPKTWTILTFQKGKRPCDTI